MESHFIRFPNQTIFITQIILERVSFFFIQQGDNRKCFIFRYCFFLLECDIDLSKNPCDIIQYNRYVGTFAFARCFQLSDCSKRRVWMAVIILLS